MEFKKKKCLVRNVVKDLKWRSVLADFRGEVLMSRRGKNHLLCGSSMELPVYYVLQNMTDFDYLECPTDICAIPLSVGVGPAGVPAGFKGTVLRILGANLHPGFARLQLPDGTLFRTRPSRNRPSNKPLQSAAVRMNHGPENSEIGRLFSYLLNQDMFIRIDEVYAIECPHWPPEAEEWIRRPRANGWPTEEIIKKVVDGGCNLIGKPHQSNPYDRTQWRFSFSKAEMILIDSWNDSQKYVYHILRLIKQEVVGECGGDENTKLCTYFFKTIMLFSCEEKPSDFWEDRGLEASIGELLCTLTCWLIEKRCPNYFVPDNNMLDHVQDDFERECEIVLKYASRAGSFLRVARKACSRCEIVCSVPNKILLLPIFWIARLKLVDPFNRSFFLDKILSARGDEYLLEELGHLCEAIACHYHLMTSSSMEDEEKALLHIEKLYETSFLKNTGVSQLKHRIAAPLSPDSIGSAEAILKSNATTVNGNWFMGNREDPMRYADPDVITVSDLTKTSCYDPDLQLNCTECRARPVFEPLLREFGRRSLTNADSVFSRPSYWVNICYLANFYYAVREDYAKAYSVSKVGMLSKNTIDGQSHMLFPVVFNSNWSEIFDGFIQAIVGFHLLVRRTRFWVYPASDVRVPREFRCKIRSRIKICPVIFLYYIHIRCCRELNRFEEMSDACDKMQQHQMRCSSEYDDLNSVILCRLGLRCVNSNFP